MMMDLAECLPVLRSYYSMAIPNEENYFSNILLIDNIIIFDNKVKELEHHNQ